jgi:hypothetical protein
LLDLSGEIRQWLIGNDYRTVTLTSGESHEESRKKKISRGGIAGKKSEKKETLAAPFTKALPETRPAASCRRESRLVMPQQKRNKDRQEGCTR